MEHLVFLNNFVELNDYGSVSNSQKLLSCVSVILCVVKRFN